MKPQQLLQGLISGQITPEEFKRLAFQPSGVQASPETIKGAFRVPVTSDGRHLETGEPMAEWLPRLKKEHTWLRVANMGIAWEEWQELKKEYEEADGDYYFEWLEITAAEMEMTVPELCQYLDDEEMKNSTLY